MIRSRIKRMMVELLAVMMIVTMLPAGALAAENSSPNLVEPIPAEEMTEQEEGSAEELIESVNAADDGAAVQPEEKIDEEISEEAAQSGELENAGDNASPELVTEVSETSEQEGVPESEGAVEPITTPEPEAEPVPEVIPDPEPVPEATPEPEPVVEPIPEIPEVTPEEPEPAEEPVKVTVNITGKTLTAEYTGEEIVVKGYDAEISDPELVSVELAEGHKAAARGTDPGVYPMNLTEENFAVTAAENVKVVLHIKDGQLEIKNRPETISVKVKVTWDDKDDWSEIRPESVKVKLLADGKEADVETLVLNGENEWSGKWTDLPKYAEDKEISYSVEEKLTDVITGEDGEESYSCKVEGNAKDGFTVVNVHTPVIYEYITGGASGKADLSGLKAGLTSIVRYPGKALRDAGDTPAHSKTAESNGDGTYKLELSVTGDADTEVETAENVNVLIVYDVSNSMTSRAGSSRYSRADQAEDVVHTFIENLATYQSTTDPSNIQAAVVTFARTASKSQDWTTDLTTGNGGVRRFFDKGGTDGRTNLNYTGNSSYGTNWQSALSMAQDLAITNRPDNDPTFVIFITDGAPTASGNGNNAINPQGASLRQLRPFYEAGLPYARTLQSNDNVVLFGIYAYGTEADLLDDEIYYSNTGTERTISGDTEATDNYFNAIETAALTQAIESIFQTIVEALGISSAAISDGTTNKVTTSTGEISELLKVDESSYQYWLSIPVVNNQFTRIDLVSGDPVTYTVTDNGDGTCTVTWGSNSVTVNGSVSGGRLKYEWTEANALYDKAPPAAKLKNGAVDWDLSSVGTLLDGVTYSVTFDVYPSQTTLDIVADIKNDPGANGAWGDLDSEIQKYIDVNGKLETNTTATLSYTDTRNGQSNEVTYDNPDPVESQAVEQIAVSKQWENELDSQGKKPVTLTVTRDGEDKYSLTLSNSNDWTDNVFISIGIMRTKKDGSEEILTPGHDFTFKEPKDLTYHWELDVPVVHPMLIDNDLVMLIKVDEKHPAGSAKTHTINGEVYYESNSSTAALTATNYRRSSLLLTKAVDGTGAPADAEFPFTLSAVNSLAPAAAPSEQEDPRHESDYWVWFSVRDKDNQPVNTGVSGATPQDGSNGWYYMPSGSTATVNVKADYSIRINNLPTGTTYSITEGTLPAGFVFESSELSIEEGEGRDSTFSGGRTTTGTIEETNTLYKVTYTNEYAVVDVTVDKVWDDADDQDGIRPSNLTLTLNGLPSGTTAPAPTVTKNGSTWTYKWEGVPKYNANGGEISYTVTEGTVPEDYEMSGSPASNGGSITNQHTPETIEIKVTKVWDDNDNEDGSRPDSVTINLLTDGEKVNDLTLPQNGKWEGTFTDLPKNADGDPITYSVTEDAVTGYKKPAIAGDAENGFTVTNSHEPKRITIEGTKTWEDADDQDGKRPDSITINLLANGDPATDSDGNAITATVTEDDDWSWKFENLPEKADGQTITYTVEEEEVEDYETEYDEDHLNVTNKYTPETTDLTVKKVWEDNDNQDGVRPSSILVRLKADGKEVKRATLSERTQWTVSFSDLAVYNKGNRIVYTLTEDALDNYTTKIEEIKADEILAGFTITNTHKPGVTSVSVSKVWEDEDDADGKRPDSVTVTLKADGKTADVKNAQVTLDEDNKWTYTWEELPEKAGGRKIKYTVDEDSVPEGYEKEVAGNALKGFTITNTHETEKITIKGKKTWDDADDQDGKRPSSITINLLADGKKVDSRTVTKNDKWRWVFENVPKLKNGKEIEYTITEEKVAEYETEVDGYNVTNTYEPEKIDIEGKKVWDDQNNKKGIRPSSITVNLLKNGEVVESKKVTESDGWKFSFTGLDKCEKGKEIKYTVTENSVDKYSTSISGDAKKGFTITNTYRPHGHEDPPDDPPSPPEEKINIPVVKYWSDNNNAAGRRPAQITIVLAADGKLTDRVLVLNAGNNWSGVFTDLPKWEAGNRIQYTILEDSVPGYVPTIAGDKDTGFTIVNTLATVPTPAKTTGDNSHMGLYGLIMLLGVLALAGFGFAVRKKEH